MTNKVKSFLPQDSQLVKTPILGMDLRDYFSAHAPTEIPIWFIEGFNQGHSNVTYSSPFFRDEEIYFSWRLYYVDQMMKRREAPNT